MKQRLLLVKQRHKYYYTGKASKGSRRERGERVDESNR